MLAPPNFQQRFYSPQGYPFQPHYAPQYYHQNNPNQNYHGQQPSFHHQQNQQYQPNHQQNNHKQQYNQNYPQLHQYIPKH